MRTEYQALALSAALLAGASGFAGAGDAKPGTFRLAGLSNPSRTDGIASRAEFNIPAKPARIVSRPLPKIAALQRRPAAPAATGRPPQVCDNITCGSYSQIGISF